MRETSNVVFILLRANVEDRAWRRFYGSGCSRRADHRWTRVRWLSDIEKKAVDMTGERRGR